MEVIAVDFVGLSNRQFGYPLRARRPGFISTRPYGANIGGFGGRKPERPAPFPHLARKAPRAAAPLQASARFFPCSSLCRIRSRPQHLKLDKYALRQTEFN